MTVGTKIMMIFFLLISFSLGILNASIVIVSEYQNTRLYFVVAIISFILSDSINNELINNEESKEYE